MPIKFLHIKLQRIGVEISYSSLYCFAHEVCKQEECGRSLSLLFRQPLSNNDLSFFHDHFYFILVMKEVNII